MILMSFMVGAGGSEGLRGYTPTLLQLLRSLRFFDSRSLQSVPAYLLDVSLTSFSRTVGKLSTAMAAHL